MNRRVEFRLCEPTDADMERPSSSYSTKGTGVKSTGSSRFIGNKNAGY